MYPDVRVRILKYAFGDELTIILRTIASNFKNASRILEIED